MKWKIQRDFSVFEVKSTPFALGALRIVCVGMDRTVGCRLSRKFLLYIHRVNIRSCKLHFSSHSTCLYSMQMTLPCTRAYVKAPRRKSIARYSSFHSIHSHLRQHVCTFLQRTMDVFNSFTYPIWGVFVESRAARLTSVTFRSLHWGMLGVNEMNEQEPVYFKVNLMNTYRHRYLI